MAKMYALTKVIMPDDREFPKRSVFDAKPALAKQLQALKSARPATKQEIEDAEKKAASATGMSFESVSEDDGKLIASDINAAPEAAEKETPPPSGASGDPSGKPKT